MNNIKRWLGIVWMILGPVTIYYLIKTAANEIAKKPVLDTKIQWDVLVIVFITIALGMIIIGYYAFKGEYDRLPKNSKEI
jgi:hypothetical protein